MVFPRMIKVFQNFIWLSVIILLAACQVQPVINEDVTPPPTVAIEDNTVSANAEVTPARYATLGFLNGGQRLELFVAEGDTVEAGQVLARVDATSAQAAVVQAEAALKRAEWQLRQLEELPTAESLAAAEAALASAEANYDRLDRAGARQIELDAAQAQIESARTSLNALKAGASTRQLDAARADVAAARAALEQAKAAMEGTELIAPFSGSVIEVLVNEFENVSPAQPVLLVADLTTLQLQTIDLNEVDVARVKVGNPVQISFDALPDRTLTGKVVRIAQKASPGAGVYFIAIIALDEIPDELRWGMSAFVIIRTE